VVAFVSRAKERLRNSLNALNGWVTGQLSSLAEAASGPIADTLEETYSAKLIEFR